MSYLYTCLCVVILRLYNFFSSFFHPSSFLTFSHPRGQNYFREICCLLMQILAISPIIFRLQFCLLVCNNPKRYPCFDPIFASCSCFVVAPLCSACATRCCLEDSHSHRSVAPQVRSGSVLRYQVTFMQKQKKQNVVGSTCLSHSYVALGNLNGCLDLGFQHFRVVLHAQCWVALQLFWAVNHTRQGKQRHI